MEIVIKMLMSQQYSKKASLKIPILKIMKFIIKNKKIFSKNKIYNKKNLMKKILIQIYKINI